jgi:co-chaperonin GroES (HSP10)
MEADRYTLPDGRTIRMVGRYILVERQPPPQVSSGGIHLVDGGKMSDGTEIGKIVAVGHETTKKGHRRQIRDVRVGCFCSYLWFYSESHTNQSMRERLGDENLSIIRPEDIGLMWEPELGHKVSDIVSLGR